MTDDRDDGRDEPIERDGNPPMTQEEDDYVPLTAPGQKELTIPLGTTLIGPCVGIVPSPGFQFSGFRFPIAVTSYGSTYAEAQARTTGFDFYSVKPADPFVIETLIRDDRHAANQG